MASSRAAIILAAGQGTRMKSSLPKVENPAARWQIGVMLPNTCLKSLRLTPMAPIIEPTVPVAWQRLRDEARAAAESEPMLRPMLEATVFSQAGLGASVAERLTGKLSGHGLDDTALRGLLREAFSQPEIETAFADRNGITDFSFKQTGHAQQNLGLGNRVYVGKIQFASAP